MPRARRPVPVAPPRYIAIALTDWSADLASHTHEPGECAECGAAVWVHPDLAAGRTVICWTCHGWVGRAAAARAVDRRSTASIQEWTYPVHGGDPATN